MKIITGLGNPGPRYQNTRHNLGFEVLDRLAARMSAAFSREKHKGLLAEAAHEYRRVLLVKPQTFMNNSGACVAPLMRSANCEPEELLVIADDVNLPLGKLRFRAGGSAGGHKGLKSIIERTGGGTFHRLRLGVGDNRNSDDLADHVLSRFPPEERAEADETAERAVGAALCWMAEGIERAMCDFN